MTFLRAAPTILCTALLSATFSPTAKADDYDKKTTVTFSGPVEIPPVYVTGMRVLPAGTYVFKLMNSSSNRHIVQIFNEDQTRIYATILAIPNYRLVAKDKTVITFNEGVRGKPESLRAWFYPGANWGEEFVYPKANAVTLAQETNLPVLALDSNVKSEVLKPEEPQIAAELSRAPVIAVTPEGGAVAIAQVVQSEPAPERATTSPATEISSDRAVVTRNRLPATASEFPLIALCGLLALGAALSVRLVRARIR